MIFEWLFPIKRAKVYASWRNTLTDLSDSASDSATSSQDKIEEIFRQFIFPWHCYIAHTQGCTKLFITERRAYLQWEIYIINHSTTCVVLRTGSSLAASMPFCHVLSHRIHIQTLQLQDNPQVFKISTCNW